MMAENSATEEAIPPEAVNSEDSDKDISAKPLQMSFADWKKSKEAKEPGGVAQGMRNGRIIHKNDNKLQGNQRNHNNNHNNGNMNNNSFPPLSRPPPLPFPLMSMGFGNFGPGPGPCGPGPGPCGPGSGPCGPGPGPMMPPNCNMGGNNMGNMGPGPGPRNHRPLQPPPFWEDMMSPQLRPPPIQPPMPKCPSLWNLVPKEKQANQRQHKSNNLNQNQQPHKKYKTSNSNNNNNNNAGSNVSNALLDAALMPPPPPPGDNNNSGSSTSTKSNKLIKIKKGGDTFVQIDGKWIQRPEAPPPLEDAPPGTKEDRQRQWREYRQAMKPFKNREFHNWKRTVQRLSKLPRDQLDEKQLDRLQKAEEYIGAHKAMLTIKHAEQWVQQSNQKSEVTTSDGKSSQVFVRKPVNAGWLNKGNNEPKTFQRGVAPVRHPTYATGRAIKGGVPGDVASVTPIQHTTVPAMGQFSELPAPPMSGGYFGYSSSNPYGQDTAGNNNNNSSSGAGALGVLSGNSSSSFYTSYNSSFIKGGTLLPP
ncbi:uncharacterized protein LOC115768542 [Drosophila novamexicana]|uniref:uncharacterized protein LOC115768542 n=1 Tax=Drosophila novamexicana TaxID=47314 RepID=UPI0011E5E414|nr:uncharacterized protein LOC115768542 [Drosophila novamexicana]